MAGWWVGSGEDDGKGQGWGWNDQRVEGRSIFVICFLTFFYQINLVFILHWRHFINIPAFLSLGTHILLFYRCSLVRRRTEVLNPVKINPSSVFNLSTSTDSTFPTIKRSLTSFCELYSSFWKKNMGVWVNSTHLRVCRFKLTQHLRAYYYTNLLILPNIFIWMCSSQYEDYNAVFSVVSSIFL